MAKMQIIFDGFKDLAEAVDKAGGDMPAAVNEALTETQKLVQANVTSAAAVYAHKGRKGYATGRMYNSIIKSDGVVWKGNIAEVNTGFALQESGGWHSIFIMYGTPRMAKDAKVYNAIKGAQTRAQIAKLQEEIMDKHLKLGGG